MFLLGQPVAHADHNMTDHLKRTGIECGFSPTSKNTKNIFQAKILVSCFKE